MMTFLSVGRGIGPLTTAPVVFTVLTIFSAIWMPLTFLAGVFYSMHSLPPFWQAVSQLNPFFYAIDGFRYGFFGQSDVSPWASLAIASAAFGALSLLTLHLLRRGYKLRH